jgi:hypothetical protein
MRTRILYQHAIQALARLFEAMHRGLALIAGNTDLVHVLSTLRKAFERHLKPAMAQALTPATASSCSQSAVAAPRCWQRIKAAGQHASARQS